MLDDRWASAREDFARIWLIDDGEIDADWPRLSERFEGAGHVVASQAGWWQGKALAAGRTIHASLYGRAAAGAENPGKGRYSDEVAVVTGASRARSPHRWWRQLLAGGATVIATTSRLDDDRLAFYRAPLPRPRPLRCRAVGGAGQHGVLRRHRRARRVGRHRADGKPGPQPIHVKDAQNADAGVPVRGAAGRRRPVRGRLARPRWRCGSCCGPSSGSSAGWRPMGADHDIASRLHVVLPGSPNRGMFGGDGAYGEAKSAFDALVTRWKAESSWAQRVSLAHALIGWTRGTGLMGHNDAIVGAVEEAGVTHLLDRGDGRRAARPVRHRVARRGGARAAVRST